MDEQVDVLLPPHFTPSGEVKSREQALKDGDWIGTFNLWIVSRNGAPSIVYQYRSPKATWAPNKLDVTAGGHYRAGEKLADGLREVEEELGRNYKPDDITYLGRKIYVGLDTAGRTKNNVIELYMTEDSTPLNEYKLQEDEVYAIVSCPVSELIKAHQDESCSFEVAGYKYDGEEIKAAVTKHSFPENWDNYHFKIALLIDRYFRGEKNLLY
jgi:hypothetical protein